MEFNEFPSKSELEELKVWLKSELDAGLNGFYHNWNIIEKEFKLNHLITLKDDGLVIGFFVWSKYKSCITIDIFSIKYNYRNKGYGQSLFTYASDLFKIKGFQTIELFCSPISSEKFWIKMGLIKKPLSGFNMHSLSYYKKL